MAEVFRCDVRLSVGNIGERMSSHPNYFQLFLIGDEEASA